MSQARLQAMTWAMFLPLLAASGPAAARAYHTETLDGHVVRCSTVNTTSLPEATLAQYRLQSHPRRGLLTCLLQQERQELEPANVPADVRARVRPVGHVWEELSIREVVINDLVSYLGTYDIETAETLQFEVMISAAHAGQLLLRFDDLDPQI
jgi:hypothetical protein